MANSDNFRNRAAACEGTDGTESLYGFGLPSTYRKPATRWPDFREDRPPRPSVITITKISGGKIA